MKNYVVFTDYYRPGKRGRIITRRHDIRANSIGEAADKALVKHANSKVSMIWPIWP
jgi:hypothetical protein